MTVLSLNAVGVTLGDPLFTDLNLTLHRSDRVGLVAANGRGKSTLLDCLAGEREPTHGEITRARGLRVGYVMQKVPLEALTHTFRDWVQGPFRRIRRRMRAGVWTWCCMTSMCLPICTRRLWPSSAAGGSARRCWRRAG